MSQDQVQLNAQIRRSQRWAMALGVVAVIAILVAIATSIMGIQAGNAASTATVVQGAALYAQSTAVAQAGSAQQAAASATIAQGAALYDQATAIAQADAAREAAANATQAQ